MSEIPTPAPSTQPDIDAGVGPAFLGGERDRSRRTRGLATYYRLRSIALETRVRLLEARLDERERQLEETVARYEQLLQRPDEEWVITTSYGPDVDPDVSDD